MVEATPFDVLIPEKEPDEQSVAANPFDVLVPDVESTETASKSEQVAEALGIMPVKGTMSMKPHNNPMDAAITMGSGIAGLISSGYAGIAGTVAGMVPGGESPNDKGTRWAKATRDAITVPPSPAGERVLGGLEKVGKAVTAIPSATGTMPQIEDTPYNLQDNTDRINAGLDKFQDVQDIGPSKAAGEKIFDVTGSPELATLTEAAPAAIAGVFGLRKPPFKAPDTPDVPTTVSGSGRASVGQPSMDTPVDFTPAETIIQHLRKGKQAKVADAVIPDAAVIESAQRLHVDLNPEHYSTNAAFQDVTRALKLQPGSALQAKEVAALAVLSKRADEVVINNKGSLDKGEFSQVIADESRVTIGELKIKANEAYDQVRTLVPIRTKVNTQLIRDYLKERLADLGGNASLLSKVEKQLLALTKRTKKGAPIAPTYAALDEIRKNVGAGFSRSGPFKDGVQGNLETVYGLLSDVQGGVARSFGAGDLYDGARGLVIARKALEDSAVQMFGRNQSLTLVPKIKSAAAGLVKGDVSKFNQLIESLPKHRRAEAAATILSDIFSGGSRRGGELSTGFSESWKALNRNKTAKDALFSHLPADVRKSFDDIGRVITGIVESNRRPLGNPSGTAGGIIKALEDLSAVEKVYDVGKKVVAAEGVSTAIGLPGAGTAGVVGTMLAKQKTPIIVAADEMLASPQFSQAVNKAIRGDTAGANKAIQGSAAYNRWLAAADNQTRANIAKVGFIAWMAEDQQ